MFKCEKQRRRNALPCQPDEMRQGPAKSKLAEKPWGVPALVEITESKTNAITNPKSHPHLRNLVQHLYNLKVTQNLFFFF